MRPPGHYDALRGQPPSRVEDDKAASPKIATLPYEPDPQPIALIEPAQAEPIDQRKRLDASGSLLRHDNNAQIRQLASEQHADRRNAQDGRVTALADEHAAKLVEQAKTLGELRNRFDTLEQDPADLVDQKVLDRAEGRHGGTEHYRQALLQQRNVSDPYETLERTAMSERAAFARDQESFDENIKAAPTIDARNSLEQQKDIQAADYLAATSHRIVDQAEMISGERMGSEAEKYRNRAQEFETENADLRSDYTRRTGRSYSHSSMADDEDRVVLRRSQESRDNAENERAPSASAGNDAKSEWSDASIEMTDSKQEKLAALEGRYAAAEARSGQTIGGPARSKGREGATD